MVSDPQVSAPALGGALGADELLQAIHHDELVLHYQPLAGPNSQEVVGVEALCRWQHPRRGLLLPQTFIAAAERHGLMTSLTNWVLRTAVSQGARWREEGAFPRRLGQPVAGKPARPSLARDGRLAPRSLGRAGGLAAGRDY